MLKFRQPRHSAAASRQGFTLVELLVAAALALIVVGVVYALFTGFQNAVIDEERRVEIAQSGRTSVGILKEDLSLIGANTRTDRNQPALIYAAPWEILFNADRETSYSELQSGASNKIEYGPSGAYEYLGQDYESDAETVHYFIDINGTQPDYEDYSTHPNDRSLYRRINKDEATEVGFGIRYDDGTMAYKNGAHVSPMMTYWGDFDFDDSTPPSLWGDASGDGVLSDSEKAVLMAGGYVWTFQGPTGTVSVGPIPDGAIFLSQDSGGDLSNSEDTDGDDELDPGEDLNHNGRLDYNLLDSVISRVDVTVSVIAQKAEKRKGQTRAYINGEPYREVTVQTSVNPRNLRRAPTRDCGLAPPAPGSVTPGCRSCGRGINVAIGRSGDDGLGENDVLWYEIYRADEDETGNLGAYQFLTIIPATGAQLVYNYLDESVEADTEYQYRVHAVDCDDQHSDAEDSSTITCATGSVPPPTGTTLWDTACYLNSTDPSNGRGSITVAWTESTDPDVSEYWIYRTDDVVTGILPSTPPIAKVEISDANTTCAIGSNVLAAEDTCKDQKFYKVGSKFVWRDEEGAPGRGTSSGPPNGMSFGIGAHDSSATFNSTDFDAGTQLYEVVAYRDTDSCLSDPDTYDSDCGNFNDAQSFNAYDDYSGPPGRFSPPWEMLVQDVSSYSSDPLTNAYRMRVSWSSSPSEFCEDTVSPNNDIPDLTQYYVYRSTEKKTVDSTSCALQPVMLVTDASGFPTGEFDFEDTGTPSAKVIAYKASDYSATYGDTLVATGAVSNYQLTDDSANMVNNAYFIVPDGGSYPDLRIDTTAPVSSLYALDGSDYTSTAPGCAGQTLSPVYEYMVAGVTADGSGDPVDTADQPWSFGASCIEEGRFDCECPTATTDETPVYCGLVDDISDNTNDAIGVAWRWASAVDAPPIGTTITLLYRDTLSGPTGPWTALEEVIDSGTDPAACGIVNDCVGYHKYEDTCPGTTYTYALQIECPDEANPSQVGCTRIHELGAVTTAGSPSQADICYEEGTPDGNDPCGLTGADCDTGLVKIEMSEVMPDCATQVLTDQDNVWWRVTRWSTNSYNGSGDPIFPTEPDNGTYECIKSDGSCPGTCGSVDNAPSQCYGTYHYTGYWLNLGRDNTGNAYAIPNAGDPAITDLYNGGNGYTYSGYSSSVNVLEFSNAGGERSYIFSEYVDPNFTYKYAFELMVTHPEGYQAGVRPACSTTAGSCDDQCVGGHDHYTAEEYTVIVDFNMDTQCYPPTVSDNPSSDNTSKPPYPASKGYRDPFGWENDDIKNSDKPFKSDNIVIISWQFWGIHWYIGDHLFKYANNELQSDLNGLFGTLFNWIVQFAFDVGFAVCDYCIEGWGIKFFCVSWVWGSCHQDLTKLKNSSYLWSNFNSGVCGSNGPGEQHRIDGAYFVQAHMRANEQNRRLDLAVRMRYTPWDLSFNGYLVELDFRGTNTVKTQVSFANANSVQDVQSATHSHSDSLDDDWHSVFLLTCKNRVSGASNYWETYIFVWHRPDASKTWDYKTETSNFYYEAPKLAFSTVGKTASTGFGAIQNGGQLFVPQGCTSYCTANTPVVGRYTCSAGAPLRCVDYLQGKFGWWIDPFIDWDATNYMMDNLRIDPYCGQCPPVGLGNWAAQADVAPQLEGGVRPFAEF
ncbi:MAG: prepilin-type N-terminal cleavage/methylation domain-containing protein [Deltaproteobacteria bacterium]|nr:prepilin-type N-terminal cleavage/methylation domain-containing protein [Deltaproteobacteria bacterium]